MSVTLELKPDAEARLAAQADRRGTSLELYLESIIAEHLSGEEEAASARTTSDDEWEEMLRQLGTSAAFARAPSLADKALDRESIYREREDAQL